MADTMTAEVLQWHPAEDLPDADTTVLMWVISGGTEHDWCSGWWDGEAWRGCNHGGKVDGQVTHWSEPAGPAA